LTTHRATVMACSGRVKQPQCYRQGPPAWAGFLTAETPQALERGAGVLSVKVCRGPEEGPVRLHGCDSSIVATVIAGFVFVGLWVMALVSLVKSDGQVPDKPGRKNKPRRKKQKSPASAQRRASRSRKKDRANLLPADATVTFAVHRPDRAEDQARA